MSDYGFKTNTLSAILDDALAPALSRLLQRVLWR
jgi:hypothetical protein